MIPKPSLKAGFGHAQGVRAGSGFSFEQGHEKTRDRVEICDVLFNELRYYKVFDYKVFGWE